VTRFFVSSLFELVSLNDWHERTLEIEKKNCPESLWTHESWFKDVSVGVWDERKAGGAPRSGQTEESPACYCTYLEQSDQERGVQILSQREV